MIKWVDVEALAKSSEDFTALVKLLESLGLRKGPVGENDISRSATFLPTELRFNLIYRKKPWDDVDLSLMVTDPDTAFELVKQRGLEILEDGSGPEPSHAARHFIVRLPGGTRLMIRGGRVDDNVLDYEHMASFEGDLRATGKQFAIVVSRFNSFITERLLVSAIDGLVRSGAKRFEDYRSLVCPGRLRFRWRRGNWRRREIRRDHLSRVFAARRYGALRRDRERSHAGDWAVGAGDWCAACFWRADLRESGAGY